jgi:hypothetical protein
MIYVTWYPHNQITCSAATMFREVLDGYPVEHCEGFGNLPLDARGMIFVFHGQAEAQKPNIAALFNKFTKELDWVLFVSLGDEGCDFPYSQLEHKNKCLWVQTPKPGKVKADRYLIEGYHPNTHAEIFNSIGSIGNPAPCWDWFFAGQVTNPRRKECVDALCEINSGFLMTTEGFMQGMPQVEYYGHMRQARIIPCPSGPLTPDSFRFAEALECGCVPILDGHAPDGIKGYWDMVLGPHHPLPVIEDWSELPAMMQSLLVGYEAIQRYTQYFWKSYKLKLRGTWLSQDLIALDAVPSHGILI